MNLPSLENIENAVGLSTKESPQMALARRLAWTWFLLREIKDDDKRRYVFDVLDQLTEHWYMCRGRHDLTEGKT